jgi:hypothetical protein
MRRSVMSVATAPRPTTAPPASNTGNFDTTLKRSPSACCEACSVLDRRAALEHLGVVRREGGRLVEREHLAVLAPHHLVAAQAEALEERSFAKR